MRVLGTAIGNYLKGIGGQFSVELPAQLHDELCDLVKACNSPQHPTSALLVTNQPVAGIPTTIWQDLLSWRTGHNRIFAWVRGSGQPDSSFESVVRKFLDGQFPGGSTSILPIEELGKMVLKEIWIRRAIPANQALFDKFLEVLEWLFDAARYAFEENGNGPLDSWSDRFLVFIAYLLDKLDETVAVYQSTGGLLPAHAWEIFRLGGLPAPVHIQGGATPFSAAPDLNDLVEQEVAVSTWDSIFNDYILSPGGSTLLFTVLDQVLSAHTTTQNPWWNFSWPKSTSSSVTRPAFLPGQSVFSQVSTAAWSSVTIGDLDEALSRLRQPIPLTLEPDPLVKPLLGAPEIMLLATRQGAVSQGHTAHRWRTRVEIKGLLVTYRGEWGQLYVQPHSPGQLQASDAWVDPSNVTIEVTQGNIRCLNLKPSVALGQRLQIAFDMEVEYPANRSNNDIVGRWNPDRRLKLAFFLKQWTGTSWSENRQIRESKELLIPSPFEVTLVVVGPDSKVLFSPGRDDQFTNTIVPSQPWTPDTSLGLQLDECETCFVTAYDGRLDSGSVSFLPVATQVLVQSTQPLGLTQTPNILGHFSGSSYLDDGDSVDATSTTGQWTVVTLSLTQRTIGPSSGVVAAIRNQPAGHATPSQESKASLQGQYQEHITNFLKKASTSSPPDSLFQFIVPTSSTIASWPEHDGTPSTKFVGNSITLPWIGNGPSQALTTSAEWKAYNQALQLVLLQLGLNTSNSVWLSGLDPSALDISTLRNYLTSFGALINAARLISPEDEFWAKYPFSVFVVEGQQGASQGRLYSILLSPLHPVRIAWTFAVARLGRSLAGAPDLSRRLLGLLEGWNIPACGFTLGPGKSLVPLAAVPLDPGDERDFLGWAALAVLDSNGLPALPPLAVGLPLPWSGRTGINDHTVARAVQDYLQTHPYLTSMSLDLRSISPSGRSQQVDKTVLSILGAPDGKTAGQLRGGTRVWDSKHRMGIPPSRDELAILRSDSQSSSPFEWIQYDPLQTQLPDADIALIEDSSMNLSLVSGPNEGAVGPIPVRRFFPTSINSSGVDEHFMIPMGDDVLGLSDCLQLIESHPKNGICLMRSSTSTGALGLSGKSQWEILGTFHLDPVQLSQFVSSLPSSQPRVLWEWHPSWLRERSRQEPDLSNRPYFVVAQVPPSISAGLSKRHGLGATQVQELLCELGQKGIGLASLIATEGTREAAALGFFYALRLFAPDTGFNQQVGWQSNLPCANQGSLVYAVLPIDPLASFIEALAGQRFDKRADLLFIVASHAKQGTSFCILPIELKHHGTPGSPSVFPGSTDPELGRARSQLKDTHTILSVMANNLNSPATVSEGYLYKVGFAALVELALSLTPCKVSTQDKSQIIGDILHGRMKAGVGSPLLAWFGAGATASGGAAHSTNTHQISGSTAISEVFIDPLRIPGLLWSNSTPSGNEGTTSAALNQAIASCLGACQLSESISPSQMDKELDDWLQQSGVKATAIATLTPPQQDQDKGKEVTTEITSQEQPTIVTVEQPRGESPIHKAEQPSEQLPKVETEEKELAKKEKAIIPPPYLIGRTSYGTRWTILGKLSSSPEDVGLDLDQPKAVGIFGYMGTGKSYLLGAIAESAVMGIKGINLLPSPLAIVIFNYRRNFRERFELSSLAFPNENPDDLDRLAREFRGNPQPVGDIHILRLPFLPSELQGQRNEEYGAIPSTELLFRASDLDMEDWELLMGQPGANLVYAQAIRQTLEDLSYSGQVSLQNISQRITGLPSTSRAAATLRLDFARRYVSEAGGTNFRELVKSGRILILDLRKPMFDKLDAMRFFLVCANQVRRMEARFNTMIVFDEAHEYLSDLFAEKIDEGLRYMRHNGMTYVFATQDVRSVPQSVSRWIGNKFVFGLGSRQNVEDMNRFAPEFRDVDLLNIGRGECLVSASDSLNGIFQRPQLIRVRPRVTKHGGTTRIFSSPSQ